MFDSSLGTRGIVASNFTSLSALDTHANHIMQPNRLIDGQQFVESILAGAPMRSPRLIFANDRTVTVMAG